MKEKKNTTKSEKREKSDNLDHIRYDMSSFKLCLIDSLPNSEIKSSGMLSAERFGCVNMAALILSKKKSDVQKK